MSIKYGKPKVLKQPPTFKIFNSKIKDVQMTPYFGVTMGKQIPFHPHLRIKRQEIEEKRAEFV